MQHEGSSCSKQLTIGSHPELDESSPHFHTLFIEGQF